MKRFLMVVTIVFAISTTAVAGNIPTGGIAPPPPPTGDGITTSSPSPGDLPTSGVYEEVEETAWSTLMAVLSLIAA